MCGDLDYTVVGIQVRIREDIVTLDRAHSHSVKSQKFMFSFPICIAICDFQSLYNYMINTEWSTKSDSWFMQQPDFSRPPSQWNHHSALLGCLKQEQGWTNFFKCLTRRCDLLSQRVVTLKTENSPQLLPLLKEKLGLAQGIKHPQDSKVIF